MLGWVRISAWFAVLLLFAALPRALKIRVSSWHGREDKYKTLCGTGHSGAHLVGLHEGCVREKKPEADVSVACGKGSKDVCEGLTNSSLDKDTQTGIYENSSIISALNLASGCHPGASQERWCKGEAATSHIPRYHRSLSLDETKSLLV